MGPLQNLHSLRNDMRDKGWIIDSFRFLFNKVNYIVLVILYLPGEYKDHYALLKLDFLHPEDFKHHLLVDANAKGLMEDARELRIFFKIPPDYKHLGDALKTLTKQLGNCIPQKVSESKSQPEKQAMVYELSNKDSEDSEKLYCYAVRRNPVVQDKETQKLRQLRRTPYNDNKTRILRKSLYQKLGKDYTISFCYCDNPEKDFPDEVIIENWIKNKSKNNISVPV